MARINRKTAKIDFTSAGQLRIPFEEFESEGERPYPGYIPGEISSVAGRRSLTLGREGAMEDNPAQRIFNYISFGSGSSGNSCYIGTRRGGFLVDAGVKADFVELTLKSNGIKMSDVKGILLTHDHADHVKYAYTLLRANKHMRLFCTNRVLNGLLRRHGISRRIKDYHNPIFKEIPFNIGDIEVTAFDVPHDGTDNMGFSLNYDNRNFVIATDLGEVSGRAWHYMSQADYLVIEANYDLQMLINGPYPEYLKARIRTSHGHLDNTDTAAFLASVASERLKYVFLCHISKDNNTPYKALAAVREALMGKGFRIGSGNETLADKECDIQLMALPRYEATRRFVFRP